MAHRSNAVLEGPGHAGTAIQGPHVPLHENNRFLIGA